MKSISISSPHNCFRGNRREKSSLSPSPLSSWHWAQTRHVSALFDWTRGLTAGLAVIIWGTWRNLTASSTPYWPYWPIGQDQPLTLTLDRHRALPRCPGPMVVILDDTSNLKIKLKNRKIGKSEIWKIGNSEYWKFRKSESWIFGKSEIRKIGNSNIRKIGNLEYRKFGKSEIWKIGKSENLEF